jgi:hypothetical protein
MYALGTVLFNIGQLDSAAGYFKRAAEMGLVSGVAGQAQVLSHKGLHSAASELLRPLLIASGVFGTNITANTSADVYGMNESAYTSTELLLAWACRGVHSKPAAEMRMAVRLLELHKTTLATVSGRIDIQTKAVAKVDDLRRRVHFCLGKLLDTMGMPMDTMDDQVVDNDDAHGTTHSIGEDSRSAGVGDLSLRLAWAHFVMGNELKRRRLGIAVDEEVLAELEHVQTLGAVFTDKPIFQSNTFPENWEQRGNTRTGTSADIVPVFVVGMMRSGTTLLAQMLGMHSKVCSLGEDRTLDNIATFFIARAKALLAERERLKQENQKQRQQQWKPQWKPQLRRQDGKADDREDENGADGVDISKLFPLGGRWTKTSDVRRAGVPSSAMDPVLVPLAHAAVERFQQHLQQKCGSTAVVAVTKMPTDWQHLWLIDSLFPQARVIRCVRDPKDVAISIYQQDFQERVPWAYSLTDIQAYQAVYDQLMLQWRGLLLVLDVMVVKYEEVVAAPEVVLRRVMQHLELQWDPSCLEFHRSQFTAHTASNEQVRRPLYRGSVGKWKRYVQFTTVAEL